MKNKRKIPLMYIFLISFILFGFQMNFVISSSCFSDGDPSGYAYAAISVAKGKGLIHDFIIYYFKKYPSNITHPLDHWFSILIFFTSFIYLFTSDIKFSLLFVTIFFEFLTVIITSIFIFRMVKNKILVFASLFLVINPAFVIFSIQGYPIILLSAFLNLSFLSILLYEIRKNKKYLLLSSIFLGLSFLSHTLGLIAYFPFLIYIFLIRRKIRNKDLLIITLIPLILYSPVMIRNIILFGKPIYSLHIFEIFKVGVTNNFYKEHFSLYFMNETYPSNEILKNPEFLFSKIKKSSFEFFFERLYWIKQEGLVKNLTPIILLLFLGGAILSILRRKKILIIQEIFIIVYITFLIIFWHYIEFYLIPILPSFIYLFSYFLDSVFSEPNIKHKKVTLTIVLFFILLIFSYMKIDIWKEKMNIMYNEKICDARMYMIKWIKNNTDKNSVIMAPIPWDISLFGERKSIPLPYSSYRSLLEIGYYYNVSYVIIPKYMTYYSSFEIMDKYKELELAYENRYFFVFRLNYNYHSQDETYNEVFFEDVFQKILEDWNIIGIKKSGFFSTRWKDKKIYIMLNQGSWEIYSEKNKKCFLEFGVISLFRNRSLEFYLNKEKFFEIRIPQIPVEFKLLAPLKEGNNKIDIKSNSCDIPSKVGAWNDNIHCLSVAFYKINMVCKDEN